MTPDSEKVLSLAEELGSEVGRESAPALLGLARAALLAGAAKPGTKTSEFRLAVLALLAGFGLVALGIYGDDAALRAHGVGIVEVAVAAYAGSRGLAKLGAAVARPNSPAA